MTTTEADARAAAEALVQSWCGWHIAPSRDDTLVLDGPGSGALILPSLHVTAITSITEDGQLLDPAVYAWSASGIVRRDSTAFWHVWSQPRWTSGLRALEVELTHGYDEWPLEVAAVLDRLTARTLEGSSVLTQVGAVSYATGEDGTPLGGTLSGSDRAVLAGYKLPHLP